MRLHYALVALLAMLFAATPADVHPTISPEKDYYVSGDEIMSRTILAPKTDDDAVTTPPPPIVTTPTPMVTIPEPRMSVSPKNFKSIAYQGGAVSFSIVVKETSGLADLKNVVMHVPMTLCLKGSTLCLNQIFPDWVSFDKNNFDVPAGGQVTVNCRIKIPEDVEPGEYFGTIWIDAENTPYTETVNVTINVLKDEIPPEITVYSPRDGEVVHRPYVTLDAVVRDNIGITSIKISVNRMIIPSPATLGLGVEIQIKQEIQLKEGLNCIRIEAEDSAGNRASETVCVEYEPILVTTPPPPIVTTPTPMVTIPEPPNPGLKRLDVSIYPKYVEAKPGDTISYTVTIDWYPPEWKGEMKISAVISAAGFEKRFKLPPVSPASAPPVTTQIPVPIPRTIPPLTYKLKLEVAASSLRVSDESELKVKAATPGFEIASGILAGAAALALRRARQK